VLISGYDTRALLTYQVRTLRSLGFGTRIVLSNSSHQRPELATSYRVSLSLYEGWPRRRREVDALGTIAPGQKLAFECDPFLEDHGTDALLIFHLVPEALAGRRECDITRDELMWRLTVQDHFVEYYKPSGYACGVLYQSGAFNYPKFAKDGSTIIQAPKCYVSTAVDSYVSVVNACPVAPYQKRATMSCALSAPDRSFETRWVETLEPFETRLIDVKAAARRAGARVGESSALDFLCFYGLSADTTLLPLIVHHQRESGRLALEHSLPPAYYGTAVNGPVRARTLASLVKAPIFGSL
jgi:hypothetical protein